MGKYSKAIKYRNFYFLSQIKIFPGMGVPVWSMTNGNKSKNMNFYVDRKKLELLHAVKAVPAQISTSFQKFHSYFFLVTWRITRSQFRPRIFLIR